MNEALNDLHGVKVKVFTLTDQYTAIDLSLWHPLTVKSFPVRGLKAFGYSPALRKNLLEGDDDILHTHGIWQYPSIAVNAWHRQTRKPYLISPHGMLDSWAVRNSAWKKKLALLFYERTHLKKAACLRAHHAEIKANTEIPLFGLKNPICIIPNGIDLPEVRSKESGVRRQKSELKILLYLGRIHPKKGLVNLLKAWAATINSQPSILNSWTLVIAGWDQNGHEQQLKKLSAELKVQDSVVFLGPKFGEEKAACYQNCDAFILPSFSEGLPMVVLEAWAYGKPVLMTPGMQFAGKDSPQTPPFESNLPRRV